MSKDKMKLSLMRHLYYQYRQTKELSISKRQYDTITWLKNKSVTSTEFANKYKISVQNASQQLANLHRKGYLVREEESDKTGGLIYRYQALSELFWENNI